jgi:GNAT superfamily N-acetyltransferase
MNINIRKAKKEDLPFLWKILYYAAFWNSNEKKPPFETVFSVPEIKKILSGWGKTSDIAIIAEFTEGNEIGGAWYRFWCMKNHSFGFIDENTPELGMAVIPGMRGKGIGSKLLKALIIEAKGNNINALSLSVAKNNPAVRLYKENGFKILKERKPDYLMILKIK